MGVNGGGAACGACVCVGAAALGCGGADACGAPERPSIEDCENVDEDVEGEDDEGEDVECAASAFDSACDFVSACVFVSARGFVSVCGFDSAYGAGSTLRGGSVREESRSPTSDHNSPASSGVYDSVLRGPPRTSGSNIGIVTEPSGEVSADGRVAFVTSKDGDVEPKEGDVDA